MYTQTTILNCYTAFNKSTYEKYTIIQNALISTVWCGRDVKKIKEKLDDKRENQ